MSSNSKVLSNRIVQLANLIFIVGLIISILMVPYGVYKFYFVRKGPIGLILIAVMIGFSFAVLFGLGLRLKENTKVNVALSIVSMVISIYALEIFLTFWPGRGIPQRIGKSENISFDKREKLEVINDLIKDGVAAYPNPIPMEYLKEFINKNSQVFPLGGISDKTIVHCNESGSWSIFKSDEHGFNNPKGFYAPHQVDVLLIGDSFTEGACVESNENMGAILRQKGFKAISLAKGGNGPLLELATLIEYAKDIKPKIVFWMYFEGNDLTGLNEEESFAFLKKYLNEDDFLQNLMVRQDDIDRLLIAYVEEQKGKKESKEIEAVAQQPIRFDLKGMLELDHVRAKTKLSLPNPATPPPPIFKKIMKKAKRIVESWGGKLYFVYLPERSRYMVDEDQLFRDPKARKYVLEIISELNIPIVDIHQEFLSHSDPLSFFPPHAAHYNAAGHFLVAERVAHRLRQDGFK